jgi:signal transduction histidine kinase
MIAIGHQAALALEDTSYYSAMVQAERLAAVGQTIAGLSHHIKNILQGIRGGSYLIEEGLRLEQPDAVRKGWSIVDRNQERVSRLVLDMLTFSKDREPEMLPGHLIEVANEVVELMQVRAGERNVRLSVECVEPFPRLLFDPEGMHHALLNVVTNAIDACESNGQGMVQISLRLDEQRQSVEVSVIDDGEGIEESEIPRVFQLFASTKGNRGTGLGLSVSQKILREHRGEIRVHSQPGKGSTFILEFPAVPAPDVDSDATRRSPELATDVRK